MNEYRMSQPKKTLMELLSINGNRVFTVTEKQFYGIVNGWTHLELMDQKSIFESIYETSYIYPTEMLKPHHIEYICPHAGTHENNLYACLISEFKSSCNYLISENKCPFKEGLLPTDIELRALKSVVCAAIQSRIEGYLIADDYYHKLKTLRGKR